MFFMVTMLEENQKNKRITPMAREFRIYKGGKSGWVEDLRNHSSNHFVCYNVSEKKSKIALGWDNEPTAAMTKVAKDKIAEYHRKKLTGEFHGSVK